MLRVIGAGAELDTIGEWSTEVLITRWAIV